MYVEISSRYDMRVRCELASDMCQNWVSSDMCQNWVSNNEARNTGLPASQARVGFPDLILRCFNQICLGSYTVVKCPNMDDQPRACKISIRPKQIFMLNVFIHHFLEMFSTHS